MEAIGIDTIKLNLNDYEVEQDNGLEVQPSAYNNKTKEMTGDFQLWEGQRGAKAWQNYEDGMSVNIKPKGSNVYCLVQYSFGRVANKNNFYPVELETMKATLTNTENRLRDLGIHTNIFNASLSRVDPFRNVLLDEKPQSYFKTLQL